MNKKISTSELKGVPETLLLPLRGRYLETIRKNGFVNDPKSVEIIDSIDHNFDSADMPWDGQMVISARTEILDEATTKFLDENPDSVVVNLGCGLDTRIERVDNERVLWYDLDLPECIELREKFFSENDRIKFIPKSVLDFSWIDHIEKGRKTLFIAEGLLIYFSEEDVKKIIFAIKDNFPDSQIIFEAYSKLIKKSWHKHKKIKSAFSMFKWGIHTGKSMEKWDKGIKFITEWPYVDRHRIRWKWMMLFRLVPPLHKIMKIVHLHFPTQNVLAKAG